MLAYTFHWSPKDLLAMTSDDLAFWGDRLRDVHRELNQAKAN